MKILVIGCGLSGSVVSRELANNGHNIEVIDIRDHVGGNIYDYVNDKGIRIHKYGPHIFHTNNKKVIDYVKIYSQWIEYKHKVKCQLDDGRLLTIPINKETSEIVGKQNLIDIFYRPYSEKMWGCKLEEIDKSVINRVKIRDDSNEFYFPEDKFQGLPRDGYTKFIMNILDHKNINIKLNRKYTDDLLNKYDHIFSSMSIDQFYKYKYGKLDYRSIKFHHLDFPCVKLFPVSNINFTNTGPFTRLTEWKNFPNHGNSKVWTSITYEEPLDFKDNHFERYYPVKDIKGINKILFDKYNKIRNKKVTFIGRLGTYSYLDMDQCISSSLHISKYFIKKSL